MAKALKLTKSPVGIFVRTGDGHSAFVPNALPRVLDLSPRSFTKVDRATRAISTLAGVGETLANPQLLVRPFLQREAVLSSRIEGTLTSVSELFLFEANESGGSADAREVSNFLKAIRQGLDLLKKLPLCKRLLNDVHATLMQDVRGGEERPGELRAVQNWIGISITTPIEDARFVPPPPQMLEDLLADWEVFVNEDNEEMPPLVRCALMHYQFETIHPYVDGNGRIGRLAIILFLCAQHVLPTPLLYLSDYFERNRDEYYDHLLNVSRTGKWEPWIDFFMEGVYEQSIDALNRSRLIRDLHADYRSRLLAQRASARALTLLDQLFINPYTTAPHVAQSLEVTHSGAQGILRKLESANIIRPFGQTWPRFYLAEELLNLIQAPTRTS